MADSLRTSEKGLEILHEARRNRGWTKTASSWLVAAHTTQSTLRRFWKRTPIIRDTFIGICQAVGVNWEEVAEPKETHSP